MEIRIGVLGQSCTICITRSFGLLIQRSGDSFFFESGAFLDYSEKEGLWENLSNVNLTSLNLPDMGPTIFWPLPGIPAPPYREIANEAKFVREALDMRAKN